MRNILIPFITMAYAQMDVSRTAKQPSSLSVLLTMVTAQIQKNDPAAECFERQK